MNAKELFHHYHKPEYRQNSMVWQVWEDGETTLTKGGELFGLRNLHLIMGGDSSKALPLSDMPIQEKLHGYAFVGSKEEADEIRKAMGIT